MPRSVLVCGGAGYIGSHMAWLLVENGYDVTVFDNLSTGHREAVQWCRFIQGDLCNPLDVERVFAETAFDTVMHFSGMIAVGESVVAPEHYYRNNVSGTLNLLRAMFKAEVRSFVFSSTAAVYGNPVSAMIDESHPVQPVNPYGWTKRIAEQALTDYFQAYGLQSVSFRYFNAAGAHPEGLLGEAHEPETHLIPNILGSILSRGDDFRVFGNDYATPDGTCIRDYVHVLDLCEAHLRAISWLDGNPGAHAFNLGNGTGFSTLEVIEAVEAVTGREVPFSIAPRRAGDAVTLVANSSLAKDKLGWRPAYPEIEAIIETAWRWHRSPRF